MSTGDWQFNQLAVQIANAFAIENQILRILPALPRHRRCPPPLTPLNAATTENSYDPLLCQR